MWKGGIKQIKQEEMDANEIEFKISELEAEKLLAEAQIKALQDCNETRAILIHELQRQKQLTVALQDNG